MRLFNPIFTFCVALLCAGSAIAAEQSATEATRIAVARGWIESNQSGFAASRDYYAAHMAEAGFVTTSRYAGFGIDFDNEKPDEMIVKGFRPDSPVSKILQVGDKILAVGGVPYTKANRHKLPMRGKVGVAVKTKILRGSKVMNVDLVRAIISPKWDKKSVMEYMAGKAPVDWTSVEMNIREIIAKDNVVYVLGWSKEREKDNENKYEGYWLVRFEFNAENKVIMTNQMNEDRLLLEQQGYSITR